METNEIEGPTTVEFRNDIMGINNLICRLCGSSSEKYLNIFSEEGITNDLAFKINEYLPINVKEDDQLPLQCCWGCTSTLLAWHELVLTVVATDNRFHQIIHEKSIADVSFTDIKDFQAESNEVGPSDPLSTSLNDFCQTTNESDPLLETGVKNEKKNRKTETIYFPQQSAGTTTTQTTTSTPFDNYSASMDQLYDLDEIEKDDVYGSNQSDSDSDKAGNDQKVFGCPYCTAVFALEKNVTKHIVRDHPGNKCLSPVPQSIPEQTYLRKERRKNNKLDQDATNAAKLVVDGRIYYNCKECGKSLHSPYTYIWHMRIHTGERPYVCDLCGKQFRVSQGLVRHLRETHQGIKKFSCDLCGRMFATRRNVEEHRRIHTNERPYICDLCGKSFKQKASLFVHKRSHKNYFPYKCSYCDQGFRTKPPLMVHITRHTGEKPYKCETCGRCFRIKYELKRHKLIHSDEKPFCCALCGLGFRQKRYLRNHMKSYHASVDISRFEPAVSQSIQRSATPPVSPFEEKHTVELSS